MGWTRKRPRTSPASMQNIGGRIAVSALAMMAMASATAPEAAASSRQATTAKSGIAETTATAPAGAGELDPTFDHDGIVTTSLDGTQRGWRVGLADSGGGKYVVAGAVDYGAGLDVVARRYNADGSPDIDFATTSIRPYDLVTGVAVRDGKTVVVGETGQYSHDSDSDFFVLQYLPDGSLDPAFGNGGVVVTSISGTRSEGASAVAIQSDGKIVVAGQAWQPDGVGARGVWAVARYLPNGDPDPDFVYGSGQMILSADQSDGELVSPPLGLSLQSDGMIVLGGVAQPDAIAYETSFAAARIRSDGAPDTSFDGDGVVLTGIGQALWDGDVAVQDDGKIVLAATTGHEFAIARYESHGALDTSFGTNGVTLTDFGSEIPYIGAIALQPESGAGAGQSIVAAGGVAQDFTLVRYGPDGQLDQEFGSAGIVTTDFGGTEYAEAVLAQADGKIVAAGWASSSSGPATWALARYLSGETPPPLAYPAEGQTLDFEGSYMFKATPVAGADGYLIGLFQDGVLQVENLRDYGSLDAEFALHRGDPMRTRLRPYAPITLSVRARIGGQWTEARTVTISLVPRQTQVKVLDLRYFPVDEKGMIDESETDICCYSLDDMRKRVDGLASETERALEDSTTTPQMPLQAAYADYVPVGSFELTEPVPRSSEFTGFPDHFQMFEPIDICDWVDNQGVRDVWVWMYHTKSVAPVESNMAMGNTSSAFFNHGSYGDISNSHMVDDLPVCQSTYVVYEFNYGRGAAEAVHDYGHQRERMFGWADQALFDQFVSGGTQREVRACGNVHLPPNTATEYKYDSPAQVASNCSDWHTDGSGAVEQVGCGAWGCFGDPHVQYLVWWGQRAPGRGTTLVSDGVRMRNWNELMADFDSAAALGRSLTE